MCPDVARVHCHNSEGALDVQYVAVRGLYHVIIAAHSSQSSSQASLQSRLKNKRKLPHGNIVESENCTVINAGTECNTGFLSHLPSDMFRRHVVQCSLFQAHMGS